MVNVLNSTFDSYVNYLATGLGGGQYKIDHTTISVKLDGLTDDPAQLASAQKALALWSAVTGLTFVAVTGATVADITFTNDSTSRAYATWSGGKAIVEVAKNWMDGWSADRQWGFGSYGLQTFIHEIGHALGLSHGGPYNGSGDYATDRIFDIDTWQYSVMSYYSQDNYTANNASYLFLLGPMIGDIAAIQRMYGNLAANTGNTTYGTGSTAMLGITDFTLHPDSAFAIRDTGGLDTFDLSSTQFASFLDLRPGYFSNVNGAIGNVAIAADTIIENAKGSGYNDTIIGNTASNTLYGMAGNDILFGGQGNDVLIGGVGTDTMRGGAGNDSYNVDRVSDIVDELNDGGAGIDTVYSSVSFSLSAANVLGAVENLRLTGSANISASGNSLANAIFGNAGANEIFGAGGNDLLVGLGGNDMLVGGVGNDTMRGGVGNDRYGVDSLLDVVDELNEGGSGIDTVVATISYSLASAQVLGAVENLVLAGTANINGTGNALGNGMTGNSGSNILSGGLGNDGLNGGLGNDTLVGGAGRDIFFFASALNGTTNVDRIADFSVVDDLIDLENAIFTSLTTLGTLAASAFVRNGTGLAADASDRIIYDSVHGSLFYDADGTGAGAAIKFATLSTGLALTASDFYVI